MTFLIALALLAVPGDLQPGAAKRPPPDALVGKAAPAITADEWLPKAPEMKGKVVLLDFWATWCAPCLAQFPTMARWKKQFGDDLVIVGITNLEGQTLAQIRRFVSREKLPWPVAIDKAGATHKRVGVVPLPHTVVIDRKGIVRAVHVGNRGFEDLLPHLEQLVAER
jgi:thiol-disulfide isomerase/thioredoxin